MFIEFSLYIGQQRFFLKENITSFYNIIYVEFNYNFTLHFLVLEMMACV